MAPLPARQPGLPPPRLGGAPGAGSALSGRRSWPSRTWLGGLAVAGLIALLLAGDAHVKGFAAVDEVVRALLATVLLFAVCGYGLTRFLLPESLAPWRPLFVLPVGAAASGMALTVLGFAGLPFKLSLALVLTAGAAGGLLALRQPDRRPWAADPRQLLSLAAAVALIGAVALIPTFRSGFATVTGMASDAHQVAGAVTFIQHNYPADRNVAYPIDEVRAIWNSKYPIFYPLAGAATLSGLEPWQAMMSLTAVLLALTALGLFLFARRTLAAGPGIAALAMAIAVLDQQVFHVALHPYYNQLWGLMTLPFSIVLGQAWVEDRSRRTFAAFALMTLLGIFAYPLMLPFPLVIVAGFWLLDRRARRARGEPVEPLHPRRLWRGWRSLLWIVPLAILLLLPVRGIFEKVRGVVELPLGGERLENWGGDLTHYPPFAEFFALPDVVVLGPLAAAVLIGLAAWLFLRLPRHVGIPLLVTLGGAVATAGYFALLEHGQYFYFKLLSFGGALIVVAAVVALGRLPWRPLGAAGIAVLSITALLGAREQLAATFDQLQPETIELREWSDRLPEGASIRLDTPDQLWRAYMLSDRPLGAPRPILNFPHVPFSLDADYALREATQEPPPDAAEPEPVFENDDLHLWRLEGNRFPDLTSRELQRIAADKAVE